MKILCLIDCLGQGGAEHQIICLAYMLKQAGYDVELASYYNENFYEPLIYQYGVKWSLIPCEGKGRLSKLKEVGSYIRRNGFTHLIAYKEGASQIGCLLKMIGIKITLLVSERNTSQLINKSDKVRFFMYRWADYVIPNSYSQKEFIDNHFPFLSKKTIAITNYTDLKVFKPSEIGREYKDETTHLLVAGRISRQKNVLLFMDALRELKEQGVRLHVDWYGNVDSNESSYGDEVKRKYETLGINDILTFYPATTDIVRLYQKCDVFCLPSLYEGYPNVICEAMSTGAPILCSRVCDNPLIVEDGVNGFLFDPRDRNDISSAIACFCKLSKEEKKSMSEKSIEIANAKFAEEVFVNRYKSVLLQ